MCCLLAVALPPRCTPGRHALALLSQDNIPAVCITAVDCSRGAGGAASAAIDLKFSGEVFELQLQGSGPVHLTGRSVSGALGSTAAATATVTVTRVSQNCNRHCRSHSSSTRFILMHESPAHRPFRQAQARRADPQAQSDALAESDYTSIDDHSGSGGGGSGEPTGTVLRHLLGTDEAITSSDQDGGSGDDSQPSAGHKRPAVAEVGGFSAAGLRQVFIGGLPWDVDEQAIRDAFGDCGR